MRERLGTKGSKVRKGEHEGKTLGDRGNKAAQAAIFPLSPVVSHSFSRPRAQSKFLSDKKIKHKKQKRPYWFFHPA